jgi:serine/threonine protein kinase
MEGGNLHKRDTVICHRDDEIIPCTEIVPKQPSGQWRVLRVFGERGQNSIIYVITNNGVEYIAKFIQYSRTHQLTDLQKKQRLQDEICLQNICSQRGLAPLIYDYFYCQGDRDEMVLTAVIIMEKLNQPTLYQFREATLSQITDLATFKVNLSKVLKAYYQAMETVHQLIYELGIVHGDLHTSNVLIGGHVIDFGNARRIGPDENRDRLFRSDLRTLMIDYRSMYQAYRRSGQRLDQRTQMLLSEISKNPSYRFRWYEIEKYIMLAHLLLLQNYRYHQESIVESVMRHIDQEMKST